MTDIEMVLTGLGMSEYTNRFREEGFDTWEVAMDITEHDLAFLGVDTAHRKKLQREISKAWSHLNTQDSLVRGRKARRKDDVFRPKRAYRHRPRPDLHGPKRPLSAYTCFARDNRKTLKHEDLSFIQITRYVGKSWQMLNTEKKTEWKLQAAIARRSYLKDLETYRKTQEYDEYQLYLAEFKSKYPGTRSGPRCLSISSRRSSNTTSDSIYSSSSTHESPTNLTRVLGEIPHHPNLYSTQYVPQLQDSKETHDLSEVSRDHETISERQNTSLPYPIPVLACHSTIRPAHKSQPRPLESLIPLSNPGHMQDNSIIEYSSRHRYFETVLQNQSENGKS